MFPYLTNSYIDTWTSSIRTVDVDAYPGLSRILVLYDTEVYIDANRRKELFPIRCFSNEYIPETVSLTLKSDDEVIESQDIVK